MAEKRLIDANALEIPKYEKSEDAFIDGYRQGKIDAILEVKTLTHTVDAVEVVRCKDCVYSRQAEWYTAKLICAHQSHMYSQVPFRMPPEHFCSYGERKDNG